MPAPKPDLSKPHGRLQYARMRAGYEQEEFGKLLGYDTVSGWQKIEIGKTDIKYEHIQKANTILKLDIRYYFGEIEYEDAVPERAKKLEDLGDRLERIERKVIPFEKLDEVTEAVRDSSTLHDLVQMIFQYPPEKLRELKGVLYGWLRHEVEAPAVSGDTRERPAASQ